MNTTIIGWDYQLIEYWTDQIIDWIYYKLLIESTADIISLYRQGLGWLARHIWQTNLKPNIKARESINSRLHPAPFLFHGPLHYCLPYPCSFCPFPFFPSSYILFHPLLPNPCLLRSLHMSLHHRLPGSCPLCSLSMWPLLPTPLPVWGHLLYVVNFPLWLHPTVRTFVSKINTQWCIWTDVECPGLENVYDINLIKEISI